MSIDHWRRKIDEIDRKLVELLNQRSKCAIEIGQIKRAQNLRVYDPEREHDIFRRIKEANTGPLNGEGLQRLFERIIDECRHIERLEREKGKENSVSTVEDFPQRVTIFGVGLIGGSLGLALKRVFPRIRIAGVDKPDVLERAHQLKILDTADAQPADFVILATPVGEILKLLDQFTSNPTLVIDVGSTKLAICRKAERLRVPFIGGHPMAGLEHSGPEAANADLFHEAPFFLCPIKSTPDGGLDRFQRIVKAIGAIPHVISPEDHDRLVAQISHLPQIISTLLGYQTSAHKELAGPGLRSMTRLASSPFHVWRDIFKTSGFLPQEIESFIQRLQRILDSMEGGNFDEIESLFKHGGQE